MVTDVEAVLSRTRPWVGPEKYPAEVRRLGMCQRHFMDTLVSLSVSWAKSLGEGTRQTDLWRGRH